jgi:hypothetical protein
MRIGRVLLVAAAVGGCFSGAGAARPAAPDSCVGLRSGCFATLQDAVDAAKDGDTIHVDRGTYAGGVTVDVSVAIVGAGAQATTIRGGGPVLTIGTYDARSELTVSISGVTITGGLNGSHPDTSVSFGGGVWIPSAVDQTVGATVSIADSVISHNTVAPTVALAAGGFCGPAACAFGSGGGIDNGGRLTLSNTRVTENQAGAAGSPASGLADGGIENRFMATLTMRNSFVTGNRALAGPPNGRGASAGGIGDDGAMAIENSVITGNSVVLTHAVPSSLDEGAYAGGIAISGFAGGSATIAGSAVSENLVTATNSAGDEGTFAGGLLVEGSLALSTSAVDGNQVSSHATGSAFADGGGLEIDGTATIADSRILGNLVDATAGTGEAFAQGGGIANVGKAALQRTLVVGNRVSARGSGGAAQGGGIWNSTFDAGDAQPQLTLTGCVVTANSVSGAPGIAPEGGGLYTTAPVVRVGTVIAGNRP